MSANLYTVEHTTRYRYSNPVREAVLTLYLQPVNDESQHLESFGIATDPGAELFRFEDPFGNRGHFFDVPSEHDVLTITSRSEVAHHQTEEAETGAEPSWDDLASLDPIGNWHLLQPTDLTRPGPALESFVQWAGIGKGATPLASLHDAVSRIHATLTFAPGSTTVTSPMDVALETGRGVCQDFSHVLLAIVRGWGIPARYVSGYLFPDNEEEQVMAAASHAWVECSLPGIGWVGVDPTNNTVAPKHHIRVAVGRDYQDVPPTRGTFRGFADQTLEVSVVITAREAGAGARGR